LCREQKKHTMCELESKSQIPVAFLMRRIEVDFSLYGLMIAVFIGLIWFWNSLYVIKEWERGVVLRLGRMQPDAKGPGLRIVFLAD